MISICPARQAVYPRSRGEHSPGSASSPNASGLSPLARGTLARFPAWPHVYRFIPAHAGNSAQTGALCVDAAVYPRSRGELLLKHNRILPFRGLFPLTRGTRIKQRWNNGLYWFIPAHAGNTLRAHSSETRWKVYPRSRGEHRIIELTDVRPAGLSPLARGTQFQSFINICTPRFIPARAGNTSRRCGSCGTRAVYPRSRGEHTTIDLSPHPTERFIPARAGNTCFFLNLSRIRSVYPRSRGEHNACHDKR